MINLMDYQNQPYYCGGVRGQAGHGTAEGCSSLFTGSDDVCTNELHFYHNSGKTRSKWTSLAMVNSQFKILGHHGLLEYFNFEAVDPLRHPHCISIPEDPSDFNWQTPSHWDSQNYLNQDRDQSGPRPPIF